MVYSAHPESQRSATPIYWRFDVRPVWSASI
jgi:hypothetical protein